MLGKENSDEQTTYRIWNSIGGAGSMFPGRPGWRYGWRHCRLPGRSSGSSCRPPTALGGTCASAQEHWEEEWPQVPAPWEWAPEQIPGPLSAQLRGALVTEVVPSGPADEAGVEKGDVIIALDNRAFDQRQGLSELIRERDPEHEVVLTVVRPGEKIEVFEIDVTLGTNRDDEGNVVAYLGVFYRNVGAGIRIVPHTGGPWD